MRGDLLEILVHLTRGNALNPLLAEAKRRLYAPWAFTNPSDNAMGSVNDPPTHPNKSIGTMFWRGERR